MAGYHPTAERIFASEAIRHGWDPSRRGWPDFWMTRSDGQFAVVEVKEDDCGYWLREEQAKLMNHLDRFGIPCYRFSPTGRFVRISPRRTAQGAAPSQRRAAAG